MSMFVKKYRDLRNKGFNDVEAFGLVAFISLYVQIKPALVVTQC